MCGKVEFKIPDISLEEILANCLFRSSMKTESMLVDIYVRGNFSNFHQFAKLSNISALLT
jgi:hypothetical protein